MVSLRVVPPSTPAIPVVFDLPGFTESRFVPNWVNWSITLRRVPSPTEVRRMTAQIPIAIPRADRADRSRCPRTAPRLHEIVSRARMALAPRERGDRVEARRPPSRQETEQRADADRDGD